MSFELKQIEMVRLEDLVSSAHIYRKFLNTCGIWQKCVVNSESDYKDFGKSEIRQLSSDLNHSITKL